MGPDASFYHCLRILANIEAQKRQNGIRVVMIIDNFQGVKYFSCASRGCYNQSMTYPTSLLSYKRVFFLGHPPTLSLLSSTDFVNKSLKIR